MSSWVETTVMEYSKRLKEFVQLKIVEIPLSKRPKSRDIKQILQKEAKQIKASFPTNAFLIALDIEGMSFSSEDLALKLTKLKLNHSHLCFIIGGPEGLSTDIKECCHEKWSLSKLTLPHPFARILLLEALYRASAINANHPYHK